MIGGRRCSSPSRARSARICSRRAIIRGLRPPSSSTTSMGRRLSCPGPLTPTGLMVISIGHR